MNFQQIGVIIGICTSSLVLVNFSSLKELTEKKVLLKEVSINLAAEVNAKELEFSASGLEQSNPKLIQIIHEKLLIEPPQIPQKMPPVSVKLQEAEVNDLCTVVVPVLGKKFKIETHKSQISPRAITVGNEKAGCI